MRKLRVLTAGEFYQLVNGMDGLGWKLNGWKIKGLPASDKPAIRAQGRNVAMVALMGEAGLRVGEVVPLNWGDVVFNGQVRRIMQIHSSKRYESIRDVPLSQLCRESVERLYGLRRTLYGEPDIDWPVFVVGVGIRRLSIRAVQDMVRFAGQKHLGRHIWCHLLRHTYATRMARVLDIRGVQQVLGHARLETTQVYTHPSVSDAAAAAALL